MRIVIAEDSVLLREGLIRLLAAEGHHVHGVGTAEELIAIVGSISAEEPADPPNLPDLVITDIRMPPGHSDEGLQAAILLRSLYPHLPILVLSQYIEQSYAVDLFAEGADGLGYLLKDRVGYVDAFLDAVNRVAAGGSALDAEVIGQLMARARGRTDGLDSLSDGEREVLALMAEGRSNAAIAERLCVSLPTVEKRIGAIFGKLGLLPASEDHRRVLAVLRYLDSTTRKAQS